MKKQKLQTSRKAPQGFRAMYARTVGRKVKAAAAASADELDGDVPSVGIGKALTVILMLHVLAIIAIMVGTQWGGDDGNGKSNAVITDVDNKSANETSQTDNENIGTVYLPEPASYDLDNNVQPSSEVQSQMNDRANEAQSLAVEPRKRRPRIIKPKRDPNKAQAMIQGYSTYKIQPGDNFYRLAKKYKVKQQLLIDLNPGVNSSKMKIGMIINVPAN